MEVSGVTVEESEIGAAAMEIRMGVVLLGNAGLPPVIEKPDGPGRVRNRT